MSYESPYAGLKVVDLSQGIAGPYCAMLLAQYGATVIKVEPPEGDWARSLGKVQGDHTPFSIAGNLGKKSITLDLKNADDQAILWRMLGDADVFFEGFRPGVIDRLGFGYDAVHAINPRILYVSVSGFGQTGPLAHKPAMDPVLQAFSGFMVANQQDNGVPHRTAPIIVDMSTALYAFQAVSAALFGRQREDKGRKIEVSLMQGAANLQVVRMMQTHLFGELPRGATAPNGAFLCKQGYILLVVIRQSDFVKLCSLIGLEDVAADPRYQTPADRMAHQTLLNDLVGAALRKRPAEEWNKIFTENGLQNEVVQDYPTFIRHPQVEASDLISWLPQPGVAEPVPVTNPPGAKSLQPGDARAHAPALGEHNDEIRTQYQRSEY